MFFEKVSSRLSERDMQAVGLFVVMSDLVQTPQLRNTGIEQAHLSFDLTTWLSVPFTSIFSSEI